MGGVQVTKMFFLFQRRLLAANSLFTVHVVSRNPLGCQQHSLHCSRAKESPCPCLLCFGHRDICIPKMNEGHYIHDSLDSALSAFGCMRTDFQVDLVNILDSAYDSFGMTSWLVGSGHVPIYLLGRHTFVEFLCYKYSLFSSGWKVFDRSNVTIHESGIVVSMVSSTKSVRCEYVLSRCDCTGTLALLR